MFNLFSIEFEICHIHPGLLQGQRRFLICVIPSLLQPLRGKNTVDLIQEGSVLELQDLSDPFLYWPVRVVQNVGGRLRLRYAGLSEEDRDFWLFYLDVRLRPLSWALENHLKLETPAGKSQTRTKFCLGHF